MSPPRVRYALAWCLGLTGCIEVPAAPTNTAATVEARPTRTKDRVFTSIDFPGALSTAATGISPQGDIVGRYTDASGTDHGFLFTKGHFTSIDFPAIDFFTASAGINASGAIVGIYRLASDPSPVRHGYVLSHGDATSIDFPGATVTNALGINPQGDVVGRYLQPGGAFHGYLLSDGVFTAVDVPDALMTHAWGINPSGDIIGDYQDAGGAFHVFVLSHGVVTSIDFPSAVATAPYPLVPLGGINPSGDIVSTYCDKTPCTPTSNGDVHGFLRSASNGAFTSIDFPDARFTGANGINPRGDVTGVYIDANLKNHGFLWASP